MTLVDDNFSIPPDQGETPQPAAAEPTFPTSNETATPVASELLPLDPPPQVPYALRPEVPDDLRISWSWGHLLCFILFGFLSLLAVQTVFALYYAPHKPLPQKELEQYLFSIPQFIVGSNVTWFAVVILFLYVTLAALPGKPFWQTLGWRKFIPADLAISKLPQKLVVYFFAGAALSLLTSIAGSRVHTPDDMPIELLLKSRVGAMLMMGMAVAIAPLVEETIFRGYLYPVFVRIFSGVLRFLGVDAVQAVRTATFGSIIFTGVLFGLLHGAQLAWTWGIVSLLIFVGITFTYVRARTGTVFASYLMHLGYNSLIAFAAIASTHGFTKIPPHP
jgi:membrane protease YdiL (CAAX protease family)